MKLPLPSNNNRCNVQFQFLTTPKLPLPMTLTKSKSLSDAELPWAFSRRVSSRCGLCDRLRRSSDFCCGGHSSADINDSPARLTSVSASTHNASYVILYYYVIIAINIIMLPLLQPDDK